MIKNREKRIRRMKRTNVWIFILAYIVISLLGIGVSMLMMMFTDEYVVNSKIAKEYSKVEKMTGVYSGLRKLGTDEGAVKDLISGSFESFAVFDKDGKVKFGSNYDGLGEYESYFNLEGIDSNIRLYRSDDNKIMTVNEDHRITTTGDLQSVISYLVHSLNEEDLEEAHSAVSEQSENDQGVELYQVTVDSTADPDDESDVDAEKILEMTKIISKKFTLPLWLGCEASNGDILVVRCPVEINTYDLAVYIGIILSFYLIFYLLFLVFIITIIVTLVNQRINLNLYFTDTITRLPNRNMFLYNGEKLVRKRRNLNKSYAVVSVEFMKYNNFCLCHSMKEGEAVLTKMHKILRSNMVRGEIAAHMTIAEFALLVNYNSQEDTEERIRKILKQMDDIDPDHSFIFHVGIKVIPSAQETLEDPRRKDFDLEIEYNNACTARIPLDDKDDTKINFFDDKLIEEQQWEDKILENQNRAVENEEFVVYYQPKYDPNTDKLTGAEALIRWDSPSLGFVSPGRFIPQFEKSGFITEIDHYMLSHVASDQKKWLDMGYECVPVSVNVSRAHFIENDLAEQIRDIVDKAGAPRHLIEIELTESAFFDDKNALIDIINRLKDYGFIVSMDDFGSGYSSLNSLKDIPLDVLKLDAGFFSGDISDDRSGIVVSETIRLAKSLNMKTVAEGVEAKEQVEFLAAKGCDMIQGYYYSKPLPGNEYEQKMEKNS